MVNVVGYLLEYQGLDVRSHTVQYNVFWSVYLAGFSQCSVKSSHQLQLSM